MKREELEALGLDKQTVEAVMTAYGKGMEAVRTENRDALSHLNAELEALKSKHAEEDAARQKKERLRLLDQALGEAGVTSPLARESLARRLEEAGTAPEAVSDAIAPYRLSDPGVFEALPSADAPLPHFSRADPHGEPQDDGLYDKGTPLYHFVRPPVTKGGI